MPTWLSSPPFHTGTSLDSSTSSGQAVSPWVLPEAPHVLNRRLWNPAPQPRVSQGFAPSLWLVDPWALYFPHLLVPSVLPGEPPLAPAAVGVGWGPWGPPAGPCPPPHSLSLISSHRCTDRSTFKMCPENGSLPGLPSSPGAGPGSSAWPQPSGADFISHYILVPGTVAGPEWVLAGCW